MEPFDALYHDASPVLKAWINVHGMRVERCVVESRRFVGLLEHGAIGSVVRFNAQPKRFVVVGRPAEGRVHVVALSGARSSSEDSNARLDRMTRDTDQRLIFTGADAAHLSRRALEAARLNGTLLDLERAARAPAPVTVRPERAPREGLSADRMRAAAIRRQAQIEKALRAPSEKERWGTDERRADAQRWARDVVAFYALAKARDAGEPFPRIMTTDDVERAVRERSSWIRDMVERYQPGALEGYEGDGASLLTGLDRALRVQEAKSSVGDLEGYHPTPPALAARAVARADVRVGLRVLEPSAGSGNLADAIRALGVEPDVVERDARLRVVLQAKGYTLVGDDALSLTGEWVRIVMNPPFERGAEMDHVLAAWEHLAPGGRLVAIMSEGPFFRSDKKATAFRAWLESVDGESEKNPEGSFKGSERSTGVATRTVVVDKPMASAPYLYFTLARPYTGRPAGGRVIDASSAGRIATGAHGRVSYNDVVSFADKPSDDEIYVAQMMPVASDGGPAYASLSKWAETIE